MRKWSIAAAGVLAMVAGAHAQTLTGPAKAAHQRMTAAVEANPNLTQTPNTVLVQFAGQAQDAGVAAALAAVKGTVIWSYSLVPGLRAIEVGMPAPQAIAILNATPGVTR